MASVINQIKLGDIEYAVAASAYAECSTAGGTAAKAATICTDGDTTNKAFTLIKGVAVNVKFTVANTAESPTLNINSTGAKAIYYKGAAITASYLKADYTYTFVYNGTRWDLVGEIDTNSTYSSKTAASGGTDVSLVTTGEKYVWNNKQDAINANNKLAASNVSGLGGAATKDVDAAVTKDSTNLVTSGAVYTAIENLPEPMVFKGSLGTGGTITTLPTATASNEGFTYKVITAGTYASKAAKVGDTFISTGSTWELIPSGDEPSGTVTSVGLSLPNQFTVTVSPVTSSGTLTATWAEQTKNTVLAAPNGNNGTPGFRSLVAADIPNLSASKITSGTLADARIASASTWNAKQDAITDLATIRSGAAAGATALQQEALTNYVTNNDSRLTDSRTPKSHTHGNINNSGQITTVEATTTNVKHIAVCVDDNGTIKKMTPANIRTAIGAGTSNLTIGTSATQAAAGNHIHSDYVNQNAFSNIKVGSTTVAADTTTDTLTLEAGSNITITPDATNDKITIAASSYTLPTAGAQTKGGLYARFDEATGTLYLGTSEL